MPYYRELAGGQIFRCSECGRRKYVKYVPTSTLCRKCAAKKRSLQNIPVTLTESLIVTKAVEKRLRKTAEANIPRSKSEKVGEAVHRWLILPFWISGPFIANALFGDFSPEWWIFVLLWCLGVPYIIWLLIDRALAQPRQERREQIALKIHKLAEERKEKIEELRQFYSSPEWAAIRKQVIMEDGRVCAECKRRITNENDITVDHKYPRSKYPQLALKRDNLRVLCRRCNSKKKDKEWLDI